MWTNILLLIGMSGISMQFILIQCIVSGYQQSIFIDKYFWRLCTIIIVTVYICIFILLFFSFCGKRKWSLDRAGVLKMVEH